MKATPTIKFQTIARPVRVERRVAANIISTNRFMSRNPVCDPYSATRVVRTAPGTIEIVRGESVWIVTTR